MTRLAIIFSLLFATPAWADNYFTYDKYKNLKEKSPSVVKFYLRGIGNSIGFTQSHFVNLGGAKPFFCAPDNVVMSPALVETAIEQAYDANPEDMVKYPISMLVVMGLPQIFPCKK